LLEGSTTPAVAVGIDIAAAAAAGTPSTSTLFARGGGRPRHSACCSFGHTRTPLPVRPHHRGSQPADARCKTILLLPKPATLPFAAVPQNEPLVQRARPRCRRSANLTQGCGCDHGSNSDNCNSSSKDGVGLGMTVNMVTSAASMLFSAARPFTPPAAPPQQQQQPQRPGFASPPPPAPIKQFSSMLDNKDDDEGVSPWRLTRNSPWKFCEKKCKDSGLH